MVDDRVRYPLLLDLRNRPCLVVGGGTVAARKIAGLLDAGAVVTVVAETIDAGVQDLIDASPRAAVHLDLRAAGAHDPDASVPWALVIAATSAPAVNAGISARATNAGIPAVDATDPIGGPASIPAVLRDGPVTIAVGTGGVHPAAAAWLRDRLAEEVAPVASLLRLLDEAGAMCRETSRLDWRRIVDSGMLELIREGREDEAKERLGRCQ